MIISDTKNIIIFVVVKRPNNNVLKKKWERDFREVV